MRSTLFAVAVLGAALVTTRRSCDHCTRGRTDRPFAAPAQQFSPRSPAEQTEQQQQSMFDAAQQKLDKQLDNSLNICRC
jgi:hypothetical protein